VVAAAGPFRVDPQGTFSAAAAVGAFNDTSVQQVIGVVASGAYDDNGDSDDGEVGWLPLPEVA